MFGAPDNLGVHPFQDPGSNFRDPGDDFGFVDLFVFVIKGVPAGERIFKGPVGPLKFYYINIVNMLTWFFSI